MIGKPATERHRCSEAVHLPNCFNPGLDLTACVCGATWWRGKVGVWRSGQIRRTVGFTTTGRALTEVEGWDRYFLHLPDCEERETATAEPGHTCVETAPITAAEAFPQHYAKLEVSDS